MWEGTEIRPLTLEERLALAPERAKAWAGLLTEAQFAERNRVLYSAAFGKSRIRSIGLFLPDQPIPAASCDFVLASCLSAEGKFTAEVLASALTLEAHRGKRYMSRLLELGLGRAPACVFLYSDIGPDFYASFGFQEDAAWCEVIQPVLSASPRSPASTWRECKRSEFLRALETYRLEQVNVGESRVAFLPDEAWMEWVELKYRFYAGVKSSPDSDLFFYAVPEPKTNTGPLALAWDALAERVDVLWGDPAHWASWQNALVPFAARFESKSFRYWSNQPGKSGEKTWPMFHPAPAIDAATGWRRLRRPVQLDLALGDWW
jgi:hypothetical protein